METERICPSCHKPLPPDLPLGLCPECLMKSGLNTGTEPAVGGAAASGFVPPPAAELAKLFPQLEVLEFIGKGGMGAVYKARQPALDRFVALKILPPKAAGDPGFAERFNREARALARLNHPNIVAVYDFGQASAGKGEAAAPTAGGAATAPSAPLHYLIMEFVDGGNLRQVERAGRLTPEQALAIVPQICDALQFAHNEGIVHRDIKPENILLDKRGRVKITDFGIAKILGLTGDAAPLTGAQDVMGTPHYMAPEQIEKPRTVDHRADIYSLGVVFYEMLTGELPLGKFAPPSRKVQMDVRLDEVVLHALEKEPELRYQQASHVKTAVETIARSEGQSPKAEEPPLPPDAETLEREVLARDYVLNIRSCLRRGWALVSGNFWRIVGTTALILALVSAVDSFGEVSRSVGNKHFSLSVAGLVLSGPLMGGLYLYFLKRIRGERVRVETAFSGFSTALLHLFLASLVTNVLMVLGFVCLILPGVYLFVAWFFTLPLAIDKRLDFWPAMRLSRKAVSKHWWKLLGFLIVVGLFNLAGLLAFVVGVLVTIPVSLAALMYAYEDIFSRPGLSAMPGAQTEVAASQKSLRRGVTVVLGGILIALLLALAAVFSLKSTLIGPCLVLVVGALGVALLLLVGRSPRSRGFLAPFLLVFTMVFGVAVGVTVLMPESFISLARIKLTPQPPETLGTNEVSRVSGNYDPYLVQTEMQVMDSEQILSPVIRDLDLPHQWAKRYRQKEPLTTHETLRLLKSKLRISPVRNAGIIDISASSEEADEAARLANKIAENYVEHSKDAAFRVEIIDTAQPATRPSRPNKPFNLTIGVLLGLVLGTAVGITRAVWRPAGKS